MIIDGVFSGGGIKGFAFIGALQVLEEKGYVFKRVAGTSAGSIIAAFVAAGYTSEEIEKLFHDLHVQDLLDRRTGLLKLPFAKWLLLYWKMGLFKGDALEKWLKKKLADKNIKTFKDVPKGSLRIIASDISNGKLVVLPEDLLEYGIDPDSFSVAKAVRMSCGVPYFFQPVKIKSGREVTLFVDGGVISNFPMWLFNTDRNTRERPVLGLKLSGAESWKPNEVDNAVEMFTALFRTMLNAHDLRYISKKHVDNIIFIQMNGISALDFNVNEVLKDELIQRGRLSALNFLKKWNYL